ncbi:MAG: LacI family transcriptional regulator, partial [Eubacteriaceae bacterium]|nr:LacI family transcriptional regulator [Eubacteriaceae bacterium]
LSKTKLSTVHYDFDQIGTTAAEMILENIDKPFVPKRKISFSPMLIQRESVGAPRNFK